VKILVNHVELAGHSSTHCWKLTEKGEITMGIWGKALVVAAGLLIGSASTAMAGVDSTNSGGAVAWTDAGPVRGTVAQGYRTFQGIPFAAPPVGELRWRSPQPPQRWTQPRDATKPSGPCAQTAGGGMESTNEDCLYLNVTAPTQHGRLKPVMVWLHGGGNSYLTAGGFDAHRLALGADAVVVTTNFRLGVFGFLGHPDLPNSGAYGLEDQQAALRWVQRNAIFFGGDPANVTLFGESGGAFDVCGQLTSPTAQGLFHRAIMESGACTTSWPANGIVYGKPANSPWIPQAKADAEGVALATAHGCSDATCLRHIPAADLITVDNGPTPVVYGNRTLPQRPNEALAAGHFHQVPVISGNTRDEGRLSAAFSPSPFTEDQYHQLLTVAFGDQAHRIANEYPSSRFGSPGLAYGAMLTDHVWACPQLTDDRALARRTPTYAFEFADRQAPQGFFPFPADIPGGAFHSSEVAYLFDVAGFTPNFTPAQQQLADQMITYWGNFAATGNPNTPNNSHTPQNPALPTWPKLHTTNAQSLAPNNIHQVDLATEHNCAFWA
jgi:para-nitrobenzyl esterase